MITVRAHYSDKPICRKVFDGALSIRLKSLKTFFAVDFRFRSWVSRFRTAPGVLLFGAGRTIPEFSEKRPKMDWTTEKLKNRRNIAFP